MYLQPVRIGVAEYPADQGLSSPSPCQLHLHQRQLTQQSLFCWLPETLAFKGKKKKAPFPGHPLLTPDSGAAATNPYPLTPPRPAPSAHSEPSAAGVPERAGVRTGTHQAAGIRLATWHRPASPRELFSSDWLGLELLGIQKSEFLPGLKLPPGNKAASVRAAWGGGHLVLPSGAQGLHPSLLTLPFKASG